MATVFFFSHERLIRFLDVKDVKDVTFTLCIYKYIEIFYKFVFEETICRYMSYTIFRNEDLFENELKNMLCKSHILSKKRTI